MQKQLCVAFSKHYPMVEVGLIIGGDKVYTEFMDRPLLNAAAEGKIMVVFARQTDMRHIDRCFPRGGQPRIEEDDVRETPPAASK